MTQVVLVHYQTLELDLEKDQLNGQANLKFWRKSFFFNCQSTWMMQQLLTNFKDHPRNKLLLITGPTHMVGFIQCYQEFELSMVFSLSQSNYLMKNTRDLLNCHLNYFGLRAEWGARYLIRRSNNELSTACIVESHVSLYGSVYVTL
jgi:hypothetical protein